MSVLGQAQAGSQAKRAADSEAQQMRYMAGQARASSQRAAREEKRQARLLESRAQAVAAASGGGATDPTVVKTIADIATEGEYRALSALWEGNERAIGLEKQAKATQAEGRVRRNLGLLGAGSTLLTGGVDWFDKYGGTK